MLLENFLRELSLTRRNWKLDGLEIKNKDGESPIQAVAGVDATEYYGRAAAKLGIDTNLSYEIEMAAFASGWHDEELRRKLLEACGLCFSTN